MSCLGHRGMFYLAAAVSDFYVPWESMVRSVFRNCTCYIIFEQVIQLLTVGVQQDYIRKS
jgi:hypothetical protein